MANRTPHWRNILARSYLTDSVFSIERPVHQLFLVKKQCGLFRLWFIAIYNKTHLNLRLSAFILKYFVDSHVFDYSWVSNKRWEREKECTISLCSPSRFASPLQFVIHFFKILSHFVIQNLSQFVIRLYRTL